MTGNKFCFDGIPFDTSDSEEKALCNISWTSSDSEQEYETPRKIIKLSRKESTSWIKSFIPKSHEVFTDKQYIEDSPIIGTQVVEEMSPVLVEKQSTETPLETSPIICNRHMLKKARFKYQNICKLRKKVFVTPESSPELFQSRATQVIESESPEPTSHETMFQISQSSYYQASSSQNSSQVMADSVGSDSPKISNSDSLFHQPIKRRKKHYRKGGLASQLQKTLQLQKSRISIWQHELFMKKTDIIALNSESEIVHFVIVNIQREYGSILLECKIPQPKNLVDSSYPNCNEETIVPFLVVVSNLLNIEFLEGKKYQMFPPFCIRNVTNKSRNFECYFSVNKIISCNENYLFCYSIRTNSGLGSRTLVRKKN